MTVAVGTSTALASTGGRATLWPQQKKVCRVGDRLVAFYQASDELGALAWSTTGGTWFDYGVEFHGWNQGSTVSYQDVGGTWRLVTTWKQLGTIAGRTDGYVYARVATFSADLSEVTFDSDVLVDTQLGTKAPDLDVVPFGDGAIGLLVYAVLAEVGGAGAYGTAAVYARQLTLSSAAELAVQANRAQLNNTPAAGNNPKPTVAIDPVTRAAGVLYGSGHSATIDGLRFRKVQLAAAGPLWRPERVVSASYVNSEPNGNEEDEAVVRWSPVAASWIMGGARLLHSADSTRATKAWRQPLADDLTVPVEIFSAADDHDHLLSNGTLAVDQATGDVYFVGSHHTSLTVPQALQLRRLAYPAYSDEGYTTVDSSTDIWEVAAHSEVGGLNLLFTQGSASPWTVSYLRVPLNQPPNAPHLVSPVGGVFVDVDQAQRFDWGFSDPVGTDSQSAYELQWRAVGAASWATTGWQVTSGTRHDFAAGTFSDGVDYEWQVRTKDAGGLDGPWSASGFFAGAGAPDDLAIVAPANDSTVTARVDVTWSVSDQDSYQVRVVGDDAGSPDTDTVLSDTGEIADPAARAQTVTLDVSGVTRHLQVRVKDSGVFSEWASVRVLTSFALPGLATLTVTPMDGFIRVAVTNFPGDPDPLLPPDTGDVILQVDAGGTGDS